MIKTTGFKAVRYGPSPYASYFLASEFVPRSVFSPTWWGNGRRSQIRYNDVLRTYTPSANASFRNSQLGWRSWQGKAPARRL